MKQVFDFVSPDVSITSGTHQHQGINISGIISYPQASFRLHQSSHSCPFTGPGSSPGAHVQIDCVILVSFILEHSLGLFCLSRPGNFQEVPASQSVECPSTWFFLITFCQVMPLEQASCRSVRCPSLCCIRRTMTSLCPIVDMTPVHFIKVVSARFLHFIVNLFAICNQYLVVIRSVCSFSPYFHPLILISINDFCL